MTHYVEASEAAVCVREFLQQFTDSTNRVWKKLAWTSLLLSSKALGCSLAISKVCGTVRSPLKEAKKMSANFTTRQQSNFRAELSLFYEMLLFKDPLARWNSMSGGRGLHQAAATSRPIQRARAQQDGAHRSTIRHRRQLLPRLAHGGCAPGVSQLAPGTNQFFVYTGSNGSI